MVHLVLTRVSAARCGISLFARVTLVVCRIAVRRMTRLFVLPRVEVYFEISEGACCNAHLNHNAIRDDATAARLD